MKKLVAKMALMVGVLLQATKSPPLGANVPWDPFFPVASAMRMCWLA